MEINEENQKRVLADAKTLMERIGKEGDSEYQISVLGSTITHVFWLSELDDASVESVFAQMRVLLKHLRSHTAGTA